jgi:DNA repair photolyase
MTFDTYDRCTYGCLYCFAVYQKINSKGPNYWLEQPDFVNPERIKAMFRLEKPTQFEKYIRDRMTMQWGGMADQFDENEREHGVTLELLKFFREIKYPICFSTKATWFTKDDRYMSLIKDADHFNFKFSIINLDPVRAAVMEERVDSPQERLAAMKRLNDINPKGGVTLRLRPFIIGHTDRRDEYLDLIRAAHASGASAVTTEFYCVEARLKPSERWRYNRVSELCGFDVFEFYQKHSTGSGYMRLNYEVKRPYVDKMKALCDQLGMRFYVSDAHHKEKCSNGSCCGLPPSWNYSRGQFTEALLIAKEKGTVRWSDISGKMDHLKQINYARAEGFNTANVMNRATRGRQTLYDYLQEIWNTPNNLKSPYKYFGGIMNPTGTDENGDVIYEYRPKPCPSSTQPE